MVYQCGGPVSEHRTDYYPVEGLTALEPNLNQSLVYLSGPEPMVEALGRELKSQGLPEAQYRQDAFLHYDKHNY